jgi:hypothetical protein
MYTENNPTLDAVVTVLADGGSRNFSADAIRAMLTVLMASVGSEKKNNATINANSNADLPIVTPSNMTLGGLRADIYRVLSRERGPVSVKIICDEMGIPRNKAARRRYVWIVLKNMVEQGICRKIKEVGSHPHYCL